MSSESKKGIALFLSFQLIFFSVPVVPIHIPLISDLLAMPVASACDGSDPIDPAEDPTTPTTDPNDTSEPTITEDPDSGTVPMDDGPLSPPETEEPTAEEDTSKSTSLQAATSNVALSDLTGDEFEAADKAILTLVNLHFGITDTVTVVTMKNDAEITMTGDAASGFEVTINLYDTAYRFSVIEEEVTIGCSTELDWTATLFTEDKVKVTAIKTTMNILNRPMQNLAVSQSNALGSPAGSYDVQVVDSGGETFRIYNFAPIHPADLVATMSDIEMGQIFGSSFNFDLSSESIYEINDNILEEAVRLFLDSSRQPNFSSGTHYFDIQHYEAVEGSSPEAAIFDLISKASNGRIYRFEATETSAEILFDIPNGPVGQAILTLIDKLDLTPEDVNQISHSTDAFNIYLDLYGNRYYFNNEGAIQTRSDRDILAINDLRSRGFDLEEIEIIPDGSNTLVDLRVADSASNTSPKTTYHYTTNSSSATITAMSYQRAGRDSVRANFTSAATAVNPDVYAVKSALRSFNVREPGEIAIQMTHFAHHNSACPPTAVCLKPVPIHFETSQNRFEYTVWHNLYLPEHEDSSYQTELNGIHPRYATTHEFNFGAGKLKLGTHPQGGNFVWIEGPHEEDLEGAKVLEIYRITSIPAVATSEVLVLTPQNTSLPGLQSIEVHFDEAMGSVLHFSIKERLIGTKYYDVKTDYKIGRSEDSGYFIYKFKETIDETYDHQLRIQATEWEYSSGAFNELLKTTTTRKALFRELIHTMDHSTGSENIHYVTVPICFSSPCEPRLIVGFDDVSNLTYDLENLGGGRTVVNRLSGVDSNGEHFGFERSFEQLEGIWVEQFDYWTEETLANAAKQNLAEHLFLEELQGYSWNATIEEIVGELDVINAELITESNQMRITLGLNENRFELVSDFFHTVDFVNETKNEQLAAIESIRYLLRKMYGSNNYASGIVWDTRGIYAQVDSAVETVQGGYKIKLMTKATSKFPMAIVHEYFVYNDLNSDSPTGMSIKATNAGFHFVLDNNEVVNVHFCDIPCQEEIEITEQYPNYMERLYDIHAIARGVQHVKNHFAGDSEINLTLDAYSAFHGGHPTYGDYYRFQYDFVNLDDPDHDETIFGFQVHSWGGRNINFYENTATLRYMYGNNPLARARIALAELLDLSIEEQGDITRVSEETVNGQTQITVKYAGVSGQNHYVFMDDGENSVIQNPSLAVIRAFDYLKTIGPRDFTLEQFVFNPSSDVQQLSSTVFNVSVRENRPGKQSVTHRYYVNLNGNSVTQLGVTYRGAEISFGANQEIDSNVITAAMDHLIANGTDIGQITLGEWVDEGPRYGITGEHWQDFILTLHNSADENTYQYNVHYFNYGNPQYRVEYKGLFESYRTINELLFDGGRIVLVDPDTASNDVWRVLIQLEDEDTLDGFRTLERFNVQAGTAFPANVLFHSTGNTVFADDGANQRNFERISFYVDETDPTKVYYDLIYDEGFLVKDHYEMTSANTFVRINREVHRSEKITQTTLYEADGSIQNIKRTFLNAGSDWTFTALPSGEVTVSFVNAGGGSAFYSYTVESSQFDLSYSNEELIWQELGVIERVVGSDTAGRKVEIVMTDETITIKNEDVMALEEAKRDLMERLNLSSIDAIEGPDSAEEVPAWNTCMGWGLQHQTCEGAVGDRGYRAVLTHNGTEYEYHLAINNEWDFTVSLDPDKEVAFFIMNDIESRYLVESAGLTLRALPEPTFSESPDEYYYHYGSATTFNGVIQIENDQYRFEYAVQKRIDKDTGESTLRLRGIAVWDKNEERRIEKVYFRGFTGRPLEVRIPIPAGFEDEIEIAALDGAFNRISGYTQEGRIESHIEILEIINYQTESTRDCSYAQSCEDVRLVLASDEWIYFFEDIKQEYSPGPIVNGFATTEIPNTAEGHAMLRLMMELSLDADSLDDMTAERRGGNRIDVTFHGNVFTFMDNGAAVSPAHHVNWFRNSIDNTTHGTRTSQILSALADIKVKSDCNPAYPDWDNSPGCYSRPFEISNFVVEGIEDSQITVREIGRTGGAQLIHRYSLNNPTQLISFDYVSGSGETIHVDIDPLRSPIDIYAAESAVKDLLNNQGEPIVNLVLSSYEEILNGVQSPISCNLSDQCSRSYALEFDNGDAISYKYNVYHRVNGDLSYSPSFLEYGYPFTVQAEYDFGTGQLMVVYFEDEFPVRWQVLIRSQDETVPGQYETMESFNIYEPNLASDPLIFYPSGSADQIELKVHFNTADCPDDCYELKTMEEGFFVTNRMHLTGDGATKAYAMDKSYRKIENFEHTLLQEETFDMVAKTLTQIRRVSGNKELIYLPETNQVEVNCLSDCDNFESFSDTLDPLELNQNTIGLISSIKGLREDGMGFVEIRVTDTDILIVEENDMAAEVAANVLYGRLTNFPNSWSLSAQEINIVSSNFQAEPWDGCAGWQLDGQTCGDPLEGRSYDVELELYGIAYNFHVYLEGDEFHAVIDPAQEIAIESLNHLKQRVSWMMLEQVTALNVEHNPDFSGYPAYEDVHRFNVTITTDFEEWQFDSLRFFELTTNRFATKRFHSAKRFEQGQLKNAIYFNLSNNRHVNVNHAGQSVDPKAVERFIRSHVLGQLRVPEAVDEFKSIDISILESEETDIGNWECIQHPSLPTVDCDQVNFHLSAEEEDDLDYPGYDFIVEMKRKELPAQTVYEYIRHAALEKGPETTAILKLRRELGLNVGEVRQLSAERQGNNVTVSFYDLEFNFTSNGNSVTQETRRILDALKTLKNQAAHYQRAFDFEKFSVSMINGSEITIRETISSSEAILHTYGAGYFTNLAFERSGFETVDFDFNFLPASTPRDTHAINLAVNHLREIGEPLSEPLFTLKMENYEDFESPDGGLVNCNTPMGNCYIRNNVVLENNNARYDFDIYHWISSDNYSLTLKEPYKFTPEQLVSRMTDYSNMTQDDFDALPLGDIASNLFQIQNYNINLESELGSNPEIELSPTDLLTGAIEKAFEINEEEFRNFTAAIDYIFIIPSGFSASFILGTGAVFLSAERLLQTLALDQEAIDSQMNSDHQGISAVQLAEIDIAVSLVHEGQHIIDDKKNVIFGEGLIGSAMREEPAYWQTHEWVSKLGYAQTIVNQQRWVAERLADPFSHTDEEFTSPMAHFITGTPRLGTTNEFYSPEDVFRAYFGAREGLNTILLNEGVFVSDEEIIYEQGRFLTEAETNDLGLNPAVGYETRWNVGGEIYTLIVDSAGNVIAPDLGTLLKSTTFSTASLSLVVRQQLKVASEVTTSKALPTSLALGDLNGDEIITPGDALIIADHVQNGTPLDANQVESADVNGDGSVNMLDSRILFSVYLEQVSSLPATHLIYGDIDANGNLTPGDAKLVAEHIEGIIELTDEQKMVADMNDDGKITEEDSNIIMRRYLKKIESLSSTPSTATDDLTESKETIVSEVSKLTKLNEITVQKVVEKPIIAPKIFERSSETLNLGSRFKIVNTKAITAIPEPYRITKLHTIIPTVQTAFALNQVRLSQPKPETIISDLITVSRLVAIEPTLTLIANASAHETVFSVKDATDQDIRGVSVRYDVSTAGDDQSGLTLEGEALSLDSSILKFYGQADVDEAAGITIEGGVTLSLSITDTSGRKVDAFIILTDAINAYEVDLQEINADFDHEAIESIKITVDRDLEEDNKTAKFNLWLKGLAEALNAI